MGNVYLGDKKVTSDGWYLGDAPLFDKPFSFPIEIDGVIYEEEDAHIFVANGNQVQLPIPANDPDNCPAVLVAVNGVEVTPTYETGTSLAATSYNFWSVPANNDDTIHAIFDWDNPNFPDAALQNWYSDILQFGSRAQGEEPEDYVNPPTLPSGRIPNQLKNGLYAFWFMEANPAVIANLDVSNVTGMENMLSEASNFNQDLSKWDISNVKNVRAMFYRTAINSDISKWDTSNVENMDQMFMYATSFNQDLSEWCVNQFSAMPYRFDYQAWNWTDKDATRPQWGTCPRGEIFPDGYSIEDCHIFVANGEKAVQLPIPADDPDNCPAVFVAVDGVEVTPTHVELDEYNNPKYWTVPANENQIIHAIFDWDNANAAKQNWFSDILQFGLNSETGQRNQIKDGVRGFYYINANPAAISNLDVSNLTDMQYMFYWPGSFNQPLSGWDVSNVTDMTYMFSGAKEFNSDISQWNTSKVETLQGLFQGAPSFNGDISGWDTSNVVRMQRTFFEASSFNQDLSQWCVSNVRYRNDFDKDSGFQGQTAIQPQWGTCPRHEDIFPVRGSNGKTYEYADAHVFITYEKEREKMPCAWNPIYVAINGVSQPTGDWYDFEDGDIVHAIFDWDNVSKSQHDWFKDILQFGLNSVTNKRNQLKNGSYAFTHMDANPAVIANLDVSNLTDMQGMFSYAQDFNQDIGGWDTSNATNMSYMLAGDFLQYNFFNQDISKWNTSKVTTMRAMFYGAVNFNQDISKWDTSKVETMRYMFNNASVFNQDISGWDTSNVEDMDNMFEEASTFNQDLSEWCVRYINYWPQNFDNKANYWTKPRPVWGTCPRKEPIALPDGVLPENYELEDCHIFVANKNRIYFAIPNGTTPTFVAVDGVEMDYTDVKGNVFEDSKIHAIFDWDNANGVNQNWFSEIRQFGLNSEGERNQLKSGDHAFYDMQENLDIISNLDVSNLTDMNHMFKNASFFDQDISGWDTYNVKDMRNMFSGASYFDSDISGWNTSNVTDMSGMFSGSSYFDQDLSEWCVSLIDEVPDDFDANSAFEGNANKQPDWGTCPRGEDFLPKEYELADCHIFVANGNTVNLPIPADDPDNCPAVFVAVDGVEVTPTYVNENDPGSDSYYKKRWEISANENQIIHAIFDWDNANNAKQDWFLDILQIGLNSDGKRNQLKNGSYAFRSMTANPAIISTLDVSNLTLLNDMFSGASFTQPLSKWNTSNVTDMSMMFRFASSFNSDISKWNTSKVENMTRMFSFASSFNQDLSGWCVSLIGSEPMDFDEESGFEGQTDKQPQWGTCPPPNIDDILPEGYVTADCHVFVGTYYGTKLPIPNGTTPTFVAVDGVKKDYATEVFEKPFNDSLIYAIFDWDNSSLMLQNWYSDILQFGLNEDTGKRNQLKQGGSAFYKMRANPDIIPTLDTSNVGDMSAMFREASYFNQDLSQWCVSKIKFTPSFFDKDANAWTKPRPVWGTCPRGEDKA